MDRASLIIRGFLRDESIGKEPVTVGYLTETEDIIEKGLNQFLAELQLPAHEQVHQVYRILYFKYRSWLVWNAVTAKPFREVRRQCLQAERCASLLSRIGSSSQLQVDQLEPNTVIRRQSKSCSLLPAVSPNLELVNAFWYKQDSPNFFLCQRVQSVQFEKMARRVKIHLSQYDDVFSDLFYHPERLHLTLCVFSLKDLSEVEDCFALIRDTIDNIRRWIPQYKVELRGVSAYRDRMLFVNAIQDPNLDKLIQVIKQITSMAGFVTNIEGEFIPHVTLVKFNPRQYKKLRIPDEVLEHFAEANFGAISVDELCFCFRSSARDVVGFYPSYGQISLKNPFV